MSSQELDRLIGRAMVEPRFCEDLLRASREKAIAAFKLTLEEQAVLLSIRAATLQSFAQALHRWMSIRNGTLPLLRVLPSEDLLRTEPRRNKDPLQKQATYSDDT